MLNRKLQIIIALFITLLSIGLKFQLRDHDILYFYNTNSLQHFELAKSILPDYSNGKDLDDLLEKESGKGPSKYPTLLTRAYIYTATILNPGYNFNSDQLNYIDYAATEDSKRLISSCRLLHLFAFVGCLLLIFALPLPLTIRLVAIVLLSTSLIAQLYFTVLRIHSPVALPLLLALLLSCRYLDSKIPYLLAILSGSAAGLAASTFFTGGISLIICLAAVILRHRQEENPSLIPAVSSMVLMALSSFIVFSYFFPSVIDFVKGNGPLLSQNHFWLYTGDAAPLEHADGRWGERLSGFGLQGFVSYFQDLVGKDPLLWTTYLIGLFIIIKQKLYHDRFWALILSAILPYQIIMGFLETTDARRTVIIVPLACLIAAKGIHFVFESEKKFLRTTIGIMALFAFMTIIRYNHMTLNDTRRQLFEYVQNEIPDKSTMLIDHRIPKLISDIEYLDRHRQSNTGPAETYWSFLKGRMTEMPEMHTQLAYTFGPDYLSGLPNINVMSRIWRFNYYIENQAVDSSIRDQVKRRFQLSDPIVSFMPSAGKELAVDKMGWPSRMPYILWDLWSQESVGPEINVFKLE